VIERGGEALTIVQQFYSFAFYKAGQCLFLENSGGDFFSPTYLNGGNDFGLFGEKI
jgi:hypothetical protein